MSIKIITVFIVVLLAAARGYAQPDLRGTAVFTELTPAVERRMNERQQDSNDRNSGSRSGAMFRIFGGAAFPVGDFAKKDGGNAGYAKTGWTAGAQCITSEAVGFIVEGSYSQNNTELPSFYSAADGTYEHTGWTSVLALAGLKIGTKNSSETSFFFAPLIGALFGQYPEITLTSAVTGQVSKSPSSSSTGLAYGAAVEVLFWRHVALGAKCIASKPKFKFSENGNELEIEQNMVLLTVTLGIAF